MEITHLQFADDTVIFCPKNEVAIKIYRRLLDCFSLVLRLTTNLSKSTLIPVGCEDRWVEQMSDFLHCKLQNLPLTYLGIPLVANPNKVSTWRPVIEKVERKLALWKAKVLSRAGRLVLIKAVLNTLPLYFLSIFKISKKVARRIVQLQRNFFWSIDDKKKGIPLISWESIQKPKIYGELGVGDIIIKNAELLFKWWWRFSDKSDALWKQIIWSNHYSQKESVDVMLTVDRPGGIWVK